MSPTGAPLKVLFLSSMYFRPAGAYGGLAVHRQAVELHRRGVRVRVLCPQPQFQRPSSWGDLVMHRSRWGQEGRYLEVDEIPVTYLPFPNLPLGLLPGAHVDVLERTLTPWVQRLQGQFPLDVIHAHRLFPTGLAAVRIARRLGVPVVLSAVGSDVHTHPKRNRRILRGTKAGLEGSDAVLPVSRKLGDGIQALGARVGRIRVVYMGVDTDRFSPSARPGELRGVLGLPREGPGICSVCRLVREKGIFELLEAFERILCVHRSAWLAVVGDGPLRGELEREIRNRDLEGRVFLAGAQPHQRVPQWLNAAEIFVLASYNEGLPNVVLEAMACGRAVVSTDVGGVAEAVEDGVSGVLIPPGSAEPLASALERLMESAAERQRLGAVARERILSTFAWGKTASALVDIYEEVIRSGRGIAAPIGAREG